MKFMSIFIPAQNPDKAPRPTADQMAAMGNFAQECFKSGVLLSTEGLMHTSYGARVRLAGGAFSEANGPFPATDRVIGGYAILKTQSREEAIELSKKFLALAGDGECELRQLYEYCPGESCGAVNESSTADVKAEALA